MNNYKTYLATWQHRFDDSTTATITRYVFGIREHVSISRLSRTDYGRACRRLAKVQNTIAKGRLDGQRLAELSLEERQLKTRLLMK